MKISFRNSKKTWIQLTDGSAIHEVKGSDFNTIVTSSISGAQTVIKVTGEVQTSIDNKTAQCEYNNNEKKGF